MASFPVPICRWRFSRSARAVDLAANGFVGHLDHRRTAGLRVLLSRVFRWRFGIGWWLVVLFGLPVIALLLGLIFGGSLHTADLGPACRRCTDGVGRRLAAVATSWHIRQTTYTASRFLC
jgi:hypothetical protein